LAEGSPRDAAIRALLYIGMGGAGVDERRFNELRAIRDENQGMPLQEFKRILREQYFSLLLDGEGALDAIPKMLPPDAATRKRLLDAIRRTVEAAGPATGARAQRLAQVENILAVGKAAEEITKIEEAPRVATSPVLPATKACS
jgi:hypothetical protein